MYENEVFFSSHTSNPIICLVSDGHGRVGTAVASLDPGYKVDYEGLEIEAWRDLAIKSRAAVHPLSYCAFDNVGIVGNVFRYIAHLLDGEIAEDITSALIVISKSRDPSKIEREIGFLIDNIYAIYETPFIETLPVLLALVKDQLCSKLR